MNVSCQTKNIFLKFVIQNDVFFFNFCHCISVRSTVVLTMYYIGAYVER